MATPSTLGQYRLIAELGHGGMADVYLAVVEGPAGSGFTKLAVLKTLRRNLAEDPELVSMLMDEARLTARLSHPNVVQLFEMGRADDHHFLAMEYLEGHPLHRITRRIERQASRQGTEVPRNAYYAVLSDVLAGLHYAHSLTDYDGTPLEIVHRDVTPHNIFVTYDGAVKVVDFGVAKAVGRTTHTEHGIVKGKIRYMSPEQAACTDVDRRTDIFAAGVILWDLATGTKLWAERDDGAIARALRMGDYPTSPRERCPEVPEAIDAICRKALAFHREDRYATADQMRADLDAFVGDATAAARKTLVTSMSELFASERTKARAVIEAANLKTAVSVVALTAARGPRKKRSSRSLSPARKRDQPSVAPVVVVPPRSRKSGKSASTRRRAAEAAAKAARARSRNTVIAIALAAFAIVVAIGAYGVLPASSGGLPDHELAVVASDLTTTSHRAREKSKAESEESAAERRGIGRGRAPEQDALPTTAPLVPVEPHQRPSPATLLDGTDPWNAGSPRRAE